MNIFTHQDLLAKPTVRPEAKVLKVDQCLFHMPDDPEHFLSALTALESYENLFELEATNAIIKGGMYSDLTIHLTCKDEFKFLLNPKWIVIENNPIIFNNFEWDFEFYFDVDRAYEICKQTQMSMAQGFSVLIGSDCKTIFPSKLKTDDLKEAKPEVWLIIDSRWPSEKWADIKHLIEINYEWLNVRLVFNPTLEQLYNAFKENEVAAVIGLQGAETYMACAMKRMVIEISKGAWPNWLGKFESPHYGVIRTDDFNDVTATLLFRAFEVRIKNCRLQSRVR